MKGAHLTLERFARVNPSYGFRCTVSSCPLLSLRGNLRCGIPITKAKFSTASESKDQEIPLPLARLNFKHMKDNQQSIKENIKNRNVIANVEKVVEIYDEFRQVEVSLEKFRRERNEIATKLAEQGKMMSKEEKDLLIKSGKDLKEKAAVLESAIRKLRKELQTEGLKIPNDTHPDVPIGPEANMKVIKEKGTIKVKGNEEWFKDHLAIGEERNLFEFGKAATVSGHKFCYFKGEAALLEIALVNWAVSKLVEKGFIPISTPDLVHSDLMMSCGFQPRGEHTQIYSVQNSEICLAGTAEIPLAGLYMDSIINIEQLPIKLVGIGKCYRAEAGHGGQYNRGIYRLHQFTKVEMFVLCHPSKSNDYLHELVSIQEELYDELQLAYRVVDMPTGELGSSASRKYDIEAWMPSRGDYGEISSASNCTDYQSRRLNIRFKDMEGENQFVHTLNATACAIPRIMLSLYENNYQPDGTVVLPDCLLPFRSALQTFSKMQLRQLAHK